MSSTWQICGGKICVDGSGMTAQSVDLVGCSASNFADSAHDGNTGDGIDKRAAMRSSIHRRGSAYLSIKREMFLKTLAQVLYWLSMHKASKNARKNVLVPVLYARRVVNDFVGESCPAWGGGGLRTQPGHLLEGRGAGWKEHAIEDPLIKPTGLAERLGTSMDRMYQHTGLLLRRNDTP